MLTVKQLIAKLQQLNPDANVEGFAHNNGTVCLFDIEQDAVVYESDDRSYVDENTVVLHFNVDLPVV